jgi:hypothetical protein
MGLSSKKLKEQYQLSRIGVILPILLIILFEWKYDYLINDKTNTSGEGLAFSALLRHLDSVGEKEFLYGFLILVMLLFIYWSIRDYRRYRKQLQEENKT